MKFYCAAVSGVGPVREKNQDNLYCNGIYRRNLYSKRIFRYADSKKNSGLYAITDGMGGGVEGEIASLKAVQLLEKLDKEADQQQFERYLQMCNHEICDYREKRNRQQTGTTFAGLSVKNEKALIVNIGDSRIYHMKAGKLQQVSRDHTVSQTLIDAGILTETEARRHVSRHQLSQYLGIFPEEMMIQPFVKTVSLSPGDSMLLCSDGLIDGLDKYGIERILRDSRNPVLAVEHLYQGALDNESKDNISIILIQVEES